MFNKSFLIQLAILVPISIELQKALALDNTTKSIIKADMFEAPDETNWNDDLNKNTVTLLPTGAED